MVYVSVALVFIGMVMADLIFNRINKRGVIKWSVVMGCSEQRGINIPMRTMSDSRIV